MPCMGMFSLVGIQVAATLATEVLTPPNQKVKILDLGKVRPHIVTQAHAPGALHSCR